MAKYEKWLGASIGWFAGGPIGGLLGFAAGAYMEPESKKYQKTGHTSEFETNLIVITAAVIRADGAPTSDELSFVRGFFRDHFSADHLDEKMNILQHCLQRSYDPRKACDEMRATTSLSTRIQIINFLFELAMCDGAADRREVELLFTFAGWLNVNDVEFKKIRSSFTATESRTKYELLGVAYYASYDEVRSAYRKLVLEYHPDRNTDLSPAEQKAIAEKFRRIQEAFEKIKEERGFEG